MYPSHNLRQILIGIGFCFGMLHINAQTTITGKVLDKETGDPLIQANVRIPGAETGTVTDFDGEYQLKTSLNPPFTIVISYTGYGDEEIEVTSGSKPLTTYLASNIMLDQVEFVVERASEEEKQSPVTSETFDLAEMRETASINYYDAIGTLKEADIMPGSIGFKIINTRGFNSTTPVRSLQLIDGVDNQAPGLNFSLGNFLGPSELDVLKVDLISGAAGAYYGPSAFNGVILIETKDPFIHTGLSSFVRYGERGLMEGSIRYAKPFSNRNGDEVFAFKLNLFGFRAQDWEADNYEPITDSRVTASNPGRYDAVNIYGDEYYSPSDYTLRDGHEFLYPGLQSFYRIGYKEKDLIDYNSHNYKGGLAFHFRTNPSAGIASPVIIAGSAIGGGTTVYQGDNRFALKDIFFQQHKIEFAKADKFFLRGYFTKEDAGQSYDPYFTALRLQEMSNSAGDWQREYDKYWFQIGKIPDKMCDLGYPKFMPLPKPSFDFDSARAWYVAFHDSLAYWHTLASQYANGGTEGVSFFEPGTSRFDSAFALVTSRYNNEEGGTRFYDKSSLLHLNGEYNFTTSFLSELKIGASFRRYMPDSRGTIFSDTLGTKITNSEIGLYGGLRKKFFDQKLVLSGTVRLDKNENLKWIHTLAGSLIYQLGNETYLRASYSGAIRNPTLIDQYMYLNVGPAILAGHLGRVDSLITPESFKDYLNHNDPSLLEYFSIDPIRPERVSTYELGIRTSVVKDLFIDMTYYRNQYRDFIGYLVGLTAIIPSGPFPSPRNVQVYRYSANTSNRVVTQGFSIGINYYLNDHLTLIGNYSYNALDETVEDDPIIPAYNTPEHKYNLGFTGRDIQLTNSPLLNSVGFNVHYKWVKSYTYEGSPQFTGHVPSYGIVDAQVNTTIEKQHLTVKVGASNLLNKKHYAVYGGPRSGRMAYVSVSYHF